MIFQNTASSILIGFGFVGSLLALFLRVGGGIFTKAGRRRWPTSSALGRHSRRRPRNPATIADNVGDTAVTARYGSRLFESYEVPSSRRSSSCRPRSSRFGVDTPSLGLIFPLVARAIGVLAPSSVSSR